MKNQPMPAKQADRYVHVFAVFTHDKQNRCKHVYLANRTFVPQRFDFHCTRITAAHIRLIDRRDHLSPHQFVKGCLNAGKADFEDFWFMNEQ